MSNLSPSKYLILTDFDGTLANTFAPSPDNLGVHEVHRLVIGEIFGSEGLRAYSSIGELSNRAPLELIVEILKVNPSLAQKAREFLNTSSAPKIVWNESEPEKTMAELLVQVKLHMLLGQVGNTFKDGGEWPALYDGVSDFFKGIQRINSQGQVNMEVGVISSGHTKFIEKVFNLCGIPMPQIIVTDDDIRPRVNPREKSRRTKPSAFLFALAHRQWLKNLGVSGANFDAKTALNLRNHIAYIGDDPAKDGNMARESHAPFLLFDPHSKHGDLSGIFHFTSWLDLISALENGQVLGMMRDGHDFSEILNSIPPEARVVSREIRNNTK